MRRRVIGTWVYLIALLSLWCVAEAGWESTGLQHSGSKFYPKYITWPSFRRADHGL